MSGALVRTASGVSRGRGSQLLQMISDALSGADRAVSGYDYNNAARTLMGLNPDVQRAIRRGTAKATEAVLPLVRRDVTPEEIKEAAYRFALSQPMKNVARAVPAATVGAGVLGTGALVNAVTKTESEEERLLRQYLEMISNGGY